MTGYERLYNGGKEEEVGWGNVLGVQIRHVEKGACKLWS